MRLIVLVFFGAIFFLGVSTLNKAETSIERLGKNRYRLNISVKGSDAWEREKEKLGAMACSGEFTEITSAVDVSQVFLERYEGFVDIECQ